MTETKETAEQISLWLAEEWGRAFALILESMADVRPATACDGAEYPFSDREGALHVEQEFSLGPKCTLQVAVPELVWREAGARVLQAAGIEEVGRDDALSTFQEILSQAFSGIAQALTTRLGEEVTCTARTEQESFSGDATGLLLTVDLAGSDLKDSPVFIAPSAGLLKLVLEHRGEEVAGQSRDGSTSQIPEARSSSMSKTFDLLLGVRLPVSVSFGKTSMMVKEVLKLTTGSIVELNRAVTEPVDIIVNNCIIARGEVVVVSGNYGVRVKEIVSREQRYETGMRSSSRPWQ